MLAFADNQNYHQSALPQQYIAQRLANYFHHMYAGYEPSRTLENILELGAGTGFLTQAILNFEGDAASFFAPNIYSKQKNIQQGAGANFDAGSTSGTARRNLNCNDAASFFAKSIKNYYINEPNQGMYTQFLKQVASFMKPASALHDDFFKYLPQPAEEILQNKSLLNLNDDSNAAIISSMALQWFDDPLKCIEDIFNLQPQSIALSLPIEGSFDTWYELQDHLKITYPRADFLALEKLKKLLKHIHLKFPHYQIQCITEKVAIGWDALFYQNKISGLKMDSPQITALEMLKHLQQIGAFEVKKTKSSKNISENIAENINESSQINHFTQGRYKISDLKKLQKLLKTQIINYDILYILAKRT